MKQTLFGIAVAALFLAALWLGLPYLSSITGGFGTNNASSIPPGFVGQKTIGPWALNCMPPKTVSQNGVTMPAFSLFDRNRSPLPPPPGAQTQQLGRCRVLRAFFGPKDPKNPVMVMSFRTLGSKKTLVMLLRIPPIGKKGDFVGVRVGNKGFRLTIVECPSGLCLAASPLNAEAENLLVSNSNGIVVFPAGPDGKRHAGRFTLQGIGAAIDGLRRAES